MVKKALIYHTALSKDAPPDDLDVLDEAKFVSNILKKIGYEAEQKPFNYKIKQEVAEINPSFIFNLVEAVNGKDSLAYIAPLMFEKLKIPYTGCPASAFFKTETKTKAKRILEKNKILTPYWLTLKDLQSENTPRKKFLIKSKIDHASRNLESTLLENKEEIKNALLFKGENFFAEEYIEGREFNVSMIGVLKKGEILPIAEMMFGSNWPADKPKIVDYDAKWKENSESYNQTERTFEFSNYDKPLLAELEQICIKCWKIFDLKGYARVDFRVDKNNKPYVLEINANPCISPDAGFVAASYRAGMTDEQIIKNIIKNSCGEKFVL